LGVPVFPRDAVRNHAAVHGLSGDGEPEARDLRRSVARSCLTACTHTEFRRIMILNGHGGNAPASAVATEVDVLSPWGANQWHDWWRGSCDVAKVHETGRCGFARLMDGELPVDAGPRPSPPKEAKPAADYAKLRLAGPKEMREILGTATSGASTNGSDEERPAIWAVASRRRGG